MGVDIATYRSKIGTFKHAFGQNVVTGDVLVDVQSFRRIIIWEILCVLVIIMTLLETSLVFKYPHEFNNTIHGQKWNHWHVADYMMSLTLHFILEVICYSILLTAVLPELYSTHTGISTPFGPNVSRKYICYDSEMTVMRHMLTTKSISMFCMVGSVSFIGILLLMAGVESNPGPYEGKNTCKSSPTETEIHPLLKRLELAEYFPGKIQLFDVISIGQEDIVSFERREETKIPWILLRKLMSANETAFDLDPEERKVDASNSNYTDESSNDAEEDSDSMNFDELPTDEENILDQSKTKLNFLDVFLLVYQCCCPMLQQLLFQKMFLCRFAVPFLITSLSNDKHIVSVWPMRSLVVESSSDKNQIREYNILDLPVKCIAFSRIGRPKFSKSQLLNRFVLDESSKTFFNYNCQSGNVSKSVCIGYTETFWLLKAGTDIDKFNDAAMFLNMRGCVRSFCKQKLTFLSRFIDAISVFIQKDEFNESMGELEQITSLFETVIVVIVGSSTMSINEVAHNLSKYARDHKCTISFVETYNKTAKELKSEKKITEEIVTNIKIKTKTKLAKSFKTRLKDCTEVQECSNERYKQSVYDYTLETPMKYGTEAQTENCKYDISLETREKDFPNKAICTHEQNEKRRYVQTSKSQVNERTDTHICGDKQIEGCNIDETLATRVKECTGDQIYYEKQTETNECSQIIEMSVKECTGTHICTEKQNEKCNSGKTLEMPVKECADKQIAIVEQNEKYKHCKTSISPVKKRIDAHICTDEQNEACKYGKTQALTFCKMVNLDAEFLSLKEKVTPLQSSFAKKLGKFLKELKRDQDVKVQDKTREKIKKVRNEMKENVTEPIKHILNVLYDNTSLEKIDYFLAWLRFYISRSSRRHLLELKLRQHEAWKNFQTRKHEQQPLDGEKREIMIVESKVDAALFSVGHLFREIGLIYDNMFELKLSTKPMNIPSVIQIASVVGKLMANGHQLELIDGESFYLPRRWLSKVFVSLDKEIQSCKIMTLSVMGIQSSGKSTLLNTMFGALFSTSAGRCTRGIHAQLIPLHPDFISQRRIAYQYILILDTEGLRPTEVIHESHEHDNELATLIAGLGNTTIVNVMGENTKEIRDILQIVAHAFLRIKLANEHISLHNRCILVQQNITAITAKDSLNDGLNKLVTNLDEMTQDSAICEGIKDVCTFNQVISFDISRDVWYLKNVWHGDPPFGRVNRNYSETASRMKQKIFKEVSEVNKSPYTTVHSFIERTNDLWQGVLNENFVFSFKNSYERIAYLKMDECIQGKLCEIELYLTKESYTIAQQEFSNCHTLVKIKDCEIVINERLNTIINDKTAEAETFFKEYFDESDHRHIIVQWEENQRGRVIRFFDKIRGICKVTIRTERTKIKTNLLFQSSQKENEEALKRKTLEFAENNSMKSISQYKIDSVFEEIWTESFGKLDPSKRVNEYTLESFFYSWLIEMHKTQSPILNDILTKVNWFGKSNVNSPKSLTVENTCIDYADINFTTYEKIVKKVLNNQGEKLYAAEQFVQNLYKDINNKIDMLCRENNQISESHIRELLRYIHEQYTCSQNQMQECKVTFKEKFFVKIDVYVSIVANNIFEEHNTNYRKSLQTDYESCKRQQMLLFKGYLAIRKSEDTVADIVTEVIHRHIDSESVIQVSHQIRHILHGKLPGNKNRLIIDICDEFVDDNDFERIISYIMYPFETARMWFEQKANSFLFKENSRQFSKCSLLIVDDLLSNVIVSLMSLEGNGDEMITTNDLVSRLISNLKNNKIFIPETYFESVKRCNQVAKINLTAVCNAVNSKLKTLIVNLKGLFSSYTENTVRWKEHCPLQSMFENIWGCCELCPYCKEPCEKSTESHTEDHTCVQHRPTCCRGMMVEGLEQACSETCNYDIHANRTHKCSAFDYKCNVEKSNCEQKVHQFRDYRVFCKNWFIPPSSDMHDSSKFWLWFVGSFKKELTEKFGYKIDNISDSWSQISPDDAKESLRTTYKD